MILIDTNILIDCYHQSSPKMNSIFETADIALCGVVQAEFLHGTKTSAEVAWMRSLLEWMDYIDIQHSDWESIGFFLRTLREHGLAVPLADAIISYLAIGHDLEVWTRDRHFAQIQMIEPRLRLFTMETGND